MIGYYIHHQGLGHLTRAQSIAAACDQPVVALSSLAAPSPVTPFADWVRLARDDDAPAPMDVAAGGQLHWAPLDDPGYAARMQRLATWIAEARPAAIVVDVSVEVAALARLLGTRVVVMAGPGIRVDQPHRMAYGLAAAIVAPWPESVYRPAHLDDVAAKTSYVGAISRFDGQRPGPVAGNRTVLSLLGRGGADVTSHDLQAAAGADPTWSWSHVGGDGPWSDDVWAMLQSADVVVAHAGQNAVAEIAAARRPAVLIPQNRPFREQQETARALAAAGIALACPCWPAASQWPGILERASRLDGDGWARWSDGDGAARAAAVIGAVADA